MNKNPLIPTQAKALLLHLLGNPEMPEQLQTLHNLALYESGDAMLGPEEKSALQNAKELAVRLAKLGKKDLNYLRSLLS